MIFRVYKFPNLRSEKPYLGGADEPLTREEIVKRVLKTRKVKETTILLNLQNKKLFRRVDRNTYTYADELGQ